MLAVGLVGGGLAAWTWTVGDRLAFEMDLAMRAGLSFDPADFRHAPVPASKNAAGFYDLAERHYGALSPSERRAPYDPKTSPQDRQAVFAKLEPAFAAIRTAASRPDCDFGLPWEFVYGAPNLVNSRVFGTFLENTRRRAAAGDLDGALDDLRAVRMSATHLADNNCFGHARNREQALLEAACNLALDRHKSAGSLAKIAAFVREPGLKIDSRAEMRVSAYLDWARLQADRRMPSEGFWGSSSELKFSLVYSAAATRIVSFHRNIYQALPNRATQMDLARAVIAENRRQEDEDGLLSREVTRRYAPYMDANDLAEADILRRQVLLAIHLIDHRRRHRSLPPTLPKHGADLVDPWTGGSFRYDRTAGGFDLRSTGADGTAEYPNPGISVLVSEVRNVR